MRRPRCHRRRRRPPPIPAAAAAAAAELVLPLLRLPLAVGPTERGPGLSRQQPAPVRRGKERVGPHGLRPELAAAAASPAALAALAALAAAEPLSRARAEQRSEQRAGRPSDVRREFGQPQGSSLVPAGERTELGRIERQQAAEQLGQQHPERPPVRGLGQCGGHALPSGRSSHWPAPAAPVLLVVLVLVVLCHGRRAVPVVHCQSGLRTHVAQSLVIQPRRTASCTSSVCVAAAALLGAAGLSA